MDIKLIQLIKLGFYIICSVVMISCETIGYYSQAAQGQLGLILQRQNIDELVASRNITEDLKHKFEDQISWICDRAKQLCNHIYFDYLVELLRICCMMWVSHFLEDFRSNLKYVFWHILFRRQDVVYSISVRNL